MPKYPSLDEVYDRVKADPFWQHLRTTGIRFIPGIGCSDHAQIIAMIIGEAPGAVENTRGLPFCGPSGRMLNQLMGLAGLDKSNAFITNAVKYRPPGNRTPEGSEISHGVTCLQEEYVAIGSPKVIITLGVTARTAILFGNNSRMPSAIPLYGLPFQLREGSVTLWPMYHPAFGLRREDMQDTIEKHWEALGLWLRTQ